jgi:carbamoyl-phosphate synthase large subunit
VRKARHTLHVRPVYKRVDTCAAEFATQTAYMYSTYDEECEAEAERAQENHGARRRAPTASGRVSSSTNCCVHAALAMREDGYETIMVNCNPETVSTDYDTSRPLYFEPVTLEDVLEIVDKEKPYGVIVQYGGQTPLKLALDLERTACRSSAPRPTRSTSPRTASASRSCCTSSAEAAAEPHRAHRRSAMQLAHEIGYPLVVRPSYVLGGRAMEIVHGDKDLERYMREAVQGEREVAGAAGPLPRRRDRGRRRRISDGGEVMIGGIMEHVEQAGVHSGDSACSLPPYSLSGAAGRAAPPDHADGQGAEGGGPDERAVRDPGRHDADDAVVFVLEVNPRASRTVPFVSKATGQPLAKIAARCMAAAAERPAWRERRGDPAVLQHQGGGVPVQQVPRRRPDPGPEMRSTGEVMGVGRSFGEAMLKSQLGAGSRLPTKGTVVISVKNNDKDRACKVASDLYDLGYQIAAPRARRRPSPPPASR